MNYSNLTNEMILDLVITSFCKIRLYSIINGLLISIKIIICKYTISISVLALLNMYYLKKYKN